MRKTSVYVRVGLAAGLSLVFMPLALKRYIDGDEGYILYAARLVSEGHALYRDFFFPQAPLVPTLFALLYRIVGSGWYVARGLAGVVAVLIGLIVFELGLNYTRSLRGGLLATFLFAACGYSLGWIPIAKTYGPAALCSLAAIYVLERRGRHSALLGGFLIALALEARLYLGVIGLNAIVFILRRAEPFPTKVREICLLAAGATLGLSLLVPPFLRDFETAYFGIFEFATMRFPEQTTLFGPIEQKIDILLAELSLVGNDGAGSVQLLGLVVLAMAALFTPGLRRNRLTVTVWPTLLIVNLLPFKTFTQYVCVVVPFVAVEAAMVLAQLVSKRMPLRALMPGLAVYAVLGAFDAQRFASTGASVLGVAQDPAAMSIGQVLDVGWAIDLYGVSHAISWWPGYFVSTRTHIIPELANHFGFNVTERLDAAQRRRLRLISEPELAAAMLQARYPLVIDGNLGKPSWTAVLNARFQASRIIGRVVFWVPR